MSRAQAVLIAVLVAFAALVVVGALLSSVPLYLIGVVGAVSTYGVACLCTDRHDFFER